MKLIKPSEGKSAVAAAAYRRAAEFYNEKENRNYDYTKKQDVIHSEILIPENSPQWLKEMTSLSAEMRHKASETLWNKVELSEKRVDGQYAREVEFALPIELDEEKNIILAREFINDQFVSRGMVADWSVHWDDGNPHVHVMLTLRELTQNDFGLKNREWNKRELLIECRQKWSEYANFHLKLHQHNVRIDHRSYKDQGIDLIPTVHQGKAITDMERRGISTEIMQQANAARRENLRRIASNPAVALTLMTTKDTAFTPEQLGQELGRYINDKGNFSIVENTLTNFEKFSGETNEKEASKKILTPESIADIFKKIEQHDAVFSHDDLIKSLSSYTDNAELFAKAVIEIKASPELIYLGAGIDGRDRFTTKAMFQLENEIQKTADKLSETSHKKIKMQKIQSALNAYQAKTGNTLTEEQNNAIKHILAPSSLSCIVGRAGTGKSFSLGAAKDVWEAQGLRVRGISLSGIASDGLTKDAGIQSQTIASFKQAIEGNHLRLDKNDIIVMDEAGMTDNQLMHFVLKTAEASQAKLVLVGDPDQLQPIGAGAVFRALLERIGFAEIQTIYRQKEDWQKKATLDFAAGRVEAGLKAYEDNSCIHIEKDSYGAQQLLVNDWFKLRSQTQKALKEYLIVAHSNEDVHALNTLIRNERIHQKEIAEGYDVISHSGNLKIAQGDRLLFLKNDKRLGVKNGRFATISHVDFTETGRVLKFNVILDGTDAEVTINPTEYNHFTHGYAATVHKVQGATYDHSFVYASKGGISWDRFLSYVAMTRHRLSCHLYTHQDNTYGQFNLAKQMGKKRLKDSVMDYPLSFAQRRGIDPSNTIKNTLTQNLTSRLKAFTEKLNDRYQQWADPERYWTQKQKQAEKTLKETQKMQRNEDARLIAAYVDASRETGIAYQGLQTKLNAMGLDKISYEKDIFKLIAATIEYQQLNQALHHRNSIAAKIVPEPERYQVAITHYGLDLNKLKQQADTHQRRSEVLRYQQLAAENKTVLRDRLAFQLMENMKAYYPHLQGLNMNTQDLKQHAIAHNKRAHLKTLSSAERAAFRTVEQYRLLNTEAGKLWAEHISQSTENNLLKYHAVQHFENLSQERDALASQILEAKALHQKALNYFQIGLSAPLFYNDKLAEAANSESEARAQKRMIQLEQNAARYRRTERVKHYHKALHANDTQTRLQLAYDIIQDKKAHHGAIINLGVNTSDVWKAIYRDAKAYERQHFYNTLTEAEKTSFKLVEEYLDNRRAYGAAWREIFETEKTSHLDKKALYEKLSAYTKPYKAKRNSLAEAILLNLPQQKILDYFNIDLTVLYPQFNEHRLSEHIYHYAAETHPLKRGELAQKIIEDPKAYSKHLFEKGIAWHAVYKDTKAYQRKKLFTTLTPEEKQFLRLVSAYKAAHQKTGKAWTAVYEIKAEKAQQNENSHTLTAHTLTSQRDALAAQVLNAKQLLEFYAVMNGNARSPMDLILQAEGKALDFDKLQTQAQNHQKRLGVVSHFKDTYAALQKLLTQNNIAAGQLNIDSQTWAMLQTDTQEALKPLKQNSAVYQQALKENQLSEAVLTVLEKSLDTISVSLKTLSVIDQHKIENAALDTEQQIKISKAQRIASGTKPIQGTIAERYLREHRGIQGDLPASFRYHPAHYNHLASQKLPALVVIARNEKNEIQAVQTISLDPQTANKACGKQSKLSYGSLGHAGVLVSQGGHDKPIIIAEGAETGLSVAKAMPKHTVYAALGSSNFAHMPLGKTVKSVIFAADNDGQDAASVKQLEKAAHTLSLQGIEVSRVMPEGIKQDFNDVLKSKGLSAIKALFASPQIMRKSVNKEALELNMAEAVKKIVGDNPHVQEGMRSNNHFYLKETLEEQARAWANTQTTGENYSHVLIAQKQEDVNILNKNAYNAMREMKRIKNIRWSINTPYGWRDIANNVRIRFDKDFPEKEIKANTLGVITQIKYNTITVKLDDKREVAFTLNEYDAIDYGYALTIEQAKEKPIETHHVLITKKMDMQVLTPLIEKSNDFKCYWQQAEFSDFTSAKKHLEFELEKSKNISSPLPEAKRDNPFDFEVDFDPEK